MGRGIITLIEMDLFVEGSKQRRLADHFRGEHEGHGLEPGLHAMQRCVCVIPAEGERNGSIGLLERE